MGVDESSSGSSTEGKSAGDETELAKLVGAAAAAFVALLLGACCVYRIARTKCSGKYQCLWINRGHVKLKEEIESGMPPNIVGHVGPNGSLDDDPAWNHETFVIGDDDDDDAEAASFCEIEGFVGVT